VLGARQHGRPRTRGGRGGGRGRRATLLCGGPEDGTAVNARQIAHHSSARRSRLAHICGRRWRQISRGGAKTMTRRFGLIWAALTAVIAGLAAYFSYQAGLAAGLATRLPAGAVAPPYYWYGPHPGVGFFPFFPFFPLL